MNALATIPAAEITPGFQVWLDTGRDLLSQRNEIDWKLADWLDTGREQFVDQAGFDFLADQLGIAPKKLKTAASIAKAFPPALRDTTLTFDHYEAVASLPTPEALSVLKDAKARHLDDRETRIEAVKRRTEISATNLLPEDDWEHHELMAIERAWNRARPAVRRTFFELAQEADLGVIDA